jgi:alpha-glucosidase
VYREGLEKDYFIRNLQGDVTHGYVWPDDSVFSDFTRPEVREWWGNLGKKLVDDGASGIWNDMNEPVTFSKPFSEGGSGTGTLPLDAQQGSSVERTTHAEAHNLYGSLMARSSYEGLRRHLKGERPFVLTRSAFAGVQRWSAVWMGDNSSWWEHLEMSIPQLMNMGLSGVAFVGADIGGFTENATPELFARWVEVGSLYPFCRGHSSAGTRWQEPWTFGSQVENIARMYLDLRYRLLPYLYTLLWQASETGSPAFRPLLYEFPDDPATYHLGDQFMLGSSLMAAPILRPGRMAREVYLPQGEWIDWWSGERFKGPATILAHAPLEIMPLYVRAGSILPFGPEIEYTGQKALDPLTLEIFPGQGEFTLYEDDGQSFDYQRGVFCTTRFMMQQEGAKLTLSALPRQGAYHPAERTLEVHLHASAAARCEGHPEAHWKTRDRVLGLSLPDRGEGFCLTFTLE